MTEHDALADGLVPVTEAAPPDSGVATTRGNVKFGKWLRDEARRIEQGGRKTAIVRLGNRVALYAEPVKGLKPEAEAPTRGASKARR